MRIQMFDHVAHYQQDREEIDRAVLEVLASGKLVMGPAVRAFEEAFAAYSGARFAAGVMSGTSALLLALRALDIGPGDEVITPANSDLPTSLAISHAGATPVWAEIDPDSFNLDPAAAEAAITPRTRALLPVHLYGVPAEMTPLLALAERHGLAVVEDAALAAGARYQGRPIGSFGTLSAFSTAPGKILDGIGSGGVICYDDPDVGSRLDSLRHYGRERGPYRDLPQSGPKRPSPTVLVGYNERIDTIDAAVLQVRLTRLDATLARRRAIAARYVERFAGSGVRVQRPPEGSEPSWRMFTVRLPERDRVLDALHERGIESSLAYLPANHLEPVYRDRGFRRGSLPETEAYCDELLALPSHPYLSDADVDEVAATVVELL
jgi:dTDP-4-amino-4,6-dideoxygalactose transaminase